MPINAKIQTIEDDNAEGRRTRRRRVSLGAELKSPSGDARDGIVRNISKQGMLLQTDFPLERDEVLELELPEAGTSAARVVWADDRLYGCEFVRPIPSAAVSAALLKSNVDNPERDGEKAEKQVYHFGDWLKVLRDEKGLSGSKLAERAGVSKVTLWNWESNRAKPQPKNVSKLAAALDVSESYLLVGWKADGPLDDSQALRADGSPSHEVLSTGGSSRTDTDQRLAELVSASKSQIAELAGTTSDKVRIIIEF